MSPNMEAFLRVIRAGESSQNEEAYSVMFGGEHFASFADHPRQKHSANGLTSTAAGAYQFLASTWDECAKALGLPDFSPASQDAAAVWLIKRRGALADVEAGRIAEAIRKCAKEWASLPGSPYGQPTRTMAMALATFQRYGGLLADDAGTPLPTPIARPPAPVPAAPARTFTPAGEADAPEQQEKPMAPLLVGLAASLIDAFTPLAKEKLTKELGRHTDHPEVAEQVSAAIIETAKAATGKTDAIDATSAAKADPTVIQQVEANALDKLAALAPLLDKLAALDAQAWRAEEDSRDAAAARGRADAEDMAPQLANRAFVVYMTVFIATVLAIVVQMYFATDHKPSGELVGFFIAVATLGARQWETLFNYRFGSSRGSSAKDVVIQQMQQRGR